MGSIGFSLLKTGIWLCDVPAISVILGRFLQLQMFFLGQRIQLAEAEITYFLIFD